MNQAEAATDGPSDAAVEPARPAEPARCANCGAPLPGRFCSSCGEDHRGRSLTIRGVVGDALEAVLLWELPALRTFRDMLWRPGFVAAEYARGTRRRYSNPLKYCFAAGALAVVVLQVVLYFAGDTPRGLGANQAIHADVRVVMDWWGRWLHVVYFLTLPLLAGMLRLFNPRGGRTLLEALVLCLFVYGQVYLIQLPLIPLSVLVHQAWGYLSAMIAFGYLSWAAATFFKGRWYVIALNALVAHIIYGFVMPIVVIIAGVIVLRAVA